MNEWRKVKLGEVAEVTKLAGFEFTKYIEYVDGGEIIALRALNLRNGHLDLSDIKKIKKEISEKLLRSKLYKDDILLTYTGNGYGDCAIITEDNKYHLAPNICKITVNRKILNPYFLYSFIRTRQFYCQLTNYMVGSSQPTIPMKIIRELTIPIFNINLQNKISKILFDIDRKIELNNKINDNLEKQCITIFNKMFPQIFYGNFKVGVYLKPKRGKNLLVKNAIIGNIPVVAGGLEPAIYHNQSNTQSPVITISASGANAGFIRLWHIPVWSSDSSYIDFSVSKFIYFWYVFLKLRQKEIFDLQSGSAQPHIYPKHIEDLSINKLDLNLVESFNNIISSFFKKIGENNLENEKLINLKNYLLPKLMNGEIDVEKIKL